MDYQHKEIASMLNLAESTVHWHVRRMCRKLRVGSAKAALRKFLGSGLFPAFNLKATEDGAQANGHLKSLRQLERRFATEEACREYVCGMRWPDGFCCPYCGGRHVWRMSRGLWLCKQCRRQISVTSGTIFHETRLPLRIWLRIIGELAVQQDRVTASGLMDAVKLTGYKTAWTCLKKLRRCLGPSNCLHDGAVQFGQRFECILRRALEMPPQPFEKLITCRRRQVEPRE
jgi:ribosomal protein L37AE/L43A